MGHWKFLINDVAVASVIPEAYAQYRRPIQGAIRHFLEALPDHDQNDILEAQARLPLYASPSARLATLAHSCPVLHKLGQLIARDERITAELRAHLQPLESMAPTASIEDLRHLVTKSIGLPSKLGIVLDEHPLAEASVAVVVGFRQLDVAADLPEEGVFKILKPGVEEKLDRELRCLESVGAFLDEQCAEFRLPPLDYQELFQQVSARLRQEVRLDRERDHLRQALHNYQDQPRVQIPRLYPFQSPQVTAMERIRGVKITEAGRSLPENRRMTGRLVEALIARPLFSRDPSVLFHGDPHAGNLFWTHDGRLALLDWSLAGVLGEQDRAVIVQILLAALGFNATRMTDLLMELSAGGQRSRAAIESVARNRLRVLRYGEFPGFTWLMGLLDEAVQQGRLRMGSDLILFRKSLFTLEGVLRDLGADDDRIHQVLQAEFLRHFLSEWPARWLASPSSRSFPTRISNADLAEFFLSWPMAATRFWMDQGIDLLAPEKREPGSSHPS